jgi:NAD(P)-dependent dehydrogenase (short-subunit alcohol dehydrogenase family)
MLKTVVVGASTGLGRCIGIGLAQRGARVALMARRKDKLDDAAREAGEGTLAIACDVTDEASCRFAINEAVEGLGGINALVYAAAIGPLVMLKDADAATWRSTFDTNVMGASLITAAAVPHLAASAGTALYLSTTGSSYTPPWAGLGVYHVTKAALDRLVDSWRVEHPGIGFTRVTLGECAGGEGDAQTQFIKDWNRELAVEVMQTWFARNYLSGTMIDIEHLVTTVDSLLRAGASLQVPSITVIPRPTPSQL